MARLDTARTSEHKPAPSAETIRALDPYLNVLARSTTSCGITICVWAGKWENVHQMSIAAKGMNYTYFRMASVNR